MSKVTQAHVDTRTAEIRDAAMKMFVEKGVEGATMQDIATAAGLSAGALYRYFPGKEQLLRAVLIDNVDQARARFARIPTAIDSPLDTLAAHAPIIDEHLSTAGGRAQTVLMLESVLAAARGADEVAAERRCMWRESIAHVERLLREARAEGEIDVRTDTYALAVLIEAAITGLYMMSLELGDEVDTLAVFDSLLGAVRRRTQLALAV